MFLFIFFFYYKTQKKIQNTEAEDKLEKVEEYSWGQKDNNDEFWTKNELFNRREGEREREESSTEFIWEDKITVREKKIMKKKSQN